MMKNHSLFKLLSLGLLLSWSTQGFIPQTISSHPMCERATISHVLHANAADNSAAKEIEKNLRQELTERNSKVEDEGKYAVVDGSGMDTEKEKPSTSGSKEEPQSMNDERKMLERLIKKRAYPLFLAEKGVEIIEDTVDGLFVKGSNEVVTNGEREKVVVLGTGWGAAAFLKGIDAVKYDVTVISPRNYFLFTPMLAGASVGTVDYRSITQPIREVNRDADYLEALATDVDTENKVLTCESIICDGNSCEINEFEVSYDRLVVTIGAQTNTFGIPGVREHCNFLKQVEDARRIRTAIVNCFERANLPGLSEEDRINNLTFAIIGAGPTGIEFAAELRDFVEQDGPKYYPNLLRYVRIKVIEASSTVLAPFDKSLQEEAIKQMNRSVEFKNPDIYRLLPEQFRLVELLLDSSVKEVTAKQILLNDGSVIDYGLSVWAAGNGPLPLTLQLVEKLGDKQSEEQNVARGRLVTDAWMRAKGSNGSILAFGDCSCTTQGPDGPLPATGQVAAQQGEYLAKLMNKGYDLSPESDSNDGSTEIPPARSPDYQSTISESIASFSTGTKECAKPFQFLNLGILAYTGGGSALAQVSTAPEAQPIKGTGKVGNALWKSVYISKQVSWRNRLMVINDWARRQIFGRDITRL